MNKISLPDSIDVKIKATHFEPFINKNAVKYTEKAIKDGVKSWISPFKKPQLIGHDKTSCPIGRIINYEIIKNQKDSPDEPPNYVRLIARITDKDSIEKIIDGRYNTVSVGSKTSRVICSECSQVLTEDGLCDHKKGSYNENGDLIHWIIDEIDYTEDSFVNEPADEYTGIEEVNLGTGWIPYQTLLEDRVTLLKKISMEDCMATQTDAKLSTEARNKLSESAFCGPGRSFPAHDKAHVTAGLRLLNTSKFSDATKAKIKACLYRKGKRYGIAPTNDELQATPDLLIIGVDDEWTPEQKVEVETFFKENPNADLPETTNNTSTSDQNDGKTEQVNVEELKKPELITLVQKLQKDIEDSKKINSEGISTREAKIADLTKKLEDTATVTLQKEEEMNKLKDSIVSNIVDLKMTDNNNDERKVLSDKYLKRSVESLTDTLIDLRTNKSSSTQTNSDTKVVNTTLQADSINSDKTQKNQKPEDKFSLFERDRSSMEE
jgi:hypothetical protein